jgi:ABC-type amino acid transport substrate-binding protein
MGTGFSFSDPYIFASLTVGGVPEFVDCVDREEDFEGVCRDLKLCVSVGTTHEFIMRGIFKGTAIVGTDDLSSGVQYMNNGSCNVLAVVSSGRTSVGMIYLHNLFLTYPIDSLHLYQDSVFLGEETFRELGYNGTYKSGTKLFSREPLTLVTADYDPEWSDLINGIVRGLYLAEAWNVTQDTADDLLALLSADQEYAAMMRNVVEEFGNYAEIYNRHVKHYVPRTGLNKLHLKQDTGLLYSHPLGELERFGPGPLEGGTLVSILARNFLHCGVTPKPGFAEFDLESGSWSGFDVEFCRGLAAAIFTADRISDNLEISSIPEGEQFSALASGAVDVVAGSRVTVLADFKEPTTGLGFTFSAPYFYDDDGNAFAFATRQGDSQWSAMVFWTVTAIVHAEENGIAQITAKNMRAVNLFGENLKQIFRDCIKGVGSYGEIYNRTLQDLIPRSGRNLLNKDYDAQQFVPPFE